MIIRPFLNANEVINQYRPSEWERIVYSEFESTLTSKSRLFPCVFGVTGFKANRLRFAFPDPLTPEMLAPILEQICGAGTVISLPAGMSHGSVALEDGATYSIAFHKVDLSGHV